MITYKAIFIPDYEVAEDFSKLYSDINDCEYQFEDGDFYIWTPAHHYRYGELTRLKEHYMKAYKDFIKFVPADTGLYIMCLYIMRKED